MTRHEAGRKYMTAIHALRRETNRELDRAQVGDDPQDALLAAWDGVVKARQEYADAQ